MLLNHVILFCLGLVLSCVFTVAAAFSQTQDKILEWTKPPIGSNNETVAPTLQLFRQIDGVQIEDILVHGKSITIGESFTAPDDWLKTLTFRVKNTSDQRLDRVQLTLVLPVVGLGSPDVIFCYGCDPAEMEKGIRPGEVVELDMPDGPFYDWVVSRVVEKTGMSVINKARISHMYVKTPNGPTWFSGCVKTAKSKTPCL